MTISFKTNFNEMLSKNNPTDLSLIYLNNRSVQRNFSNLSNCLTNSSIQFSIIGRLGRETIRTRLILMATALSIKIDQIDPVVV